ncbi:MAG: helix-turn-helix transcriptional regulator [Candidatus Edwardsbacteria bacterium]|nr:helix-turn-helix transcriptional regulator [Candidatus Edwardsbacteria bacterium]MBU1576682.1 helix-turn-helix transcriptional regulator [Candidatus Edwardsbacteria bacterium]MBU2594026.1 helix-turn-helix transcriptional regulator [Candidatus Edwardsbacteria bacterium]
MDALIKLIGGNIKKIRKAQGLTQEKLGKKAGYDYRYIGFLEQSRVNPTVRTLEKVAAALNFSLRDLFPKNSEMESGKKGAPPKATEREIIMAHIMKDLNKADEKTLGSINRIIKITVSKKK